METKKPPQPTLRDQFAAAVMQGLVAHDPHLPDPTQKAYLAYRIADAMLKEREKK